MDELAALYQKRLKLQEATFTRIEHNDAFVATVYRVRLPDDREYVLKVSARPKDYLREEHFLKYFKGQIPVPSVIQTVPAEEGLKGAILLECLSGAPLKIAEIDDKVAFEMGVILAQIHLQRVSGYGDLVDKKNLTSDLQKGFTVKFEEGLSECMEVIPETLKKQCQHYFSTHLSLLDSVDGPCIVHRDFRPGNIIASNGILQGVIDWSSARAGFAEEDFCPLEHGEWAINSRKKESFLSGYRSIRPVPHYDNVMPLLRLYRAIAVMGFAIREGTWKTRDKGIFEDNKKFLEALL